VRAAEVCLVGVLGAGLALPSAAAAQQDVYADSLLELASAVSGRTGDEGPRIRASLDRLAVGLETWDRALAAIEADRRAAFARATPQEEARGRSNLARLYLSRGRRSVALVELDTAVALQPDRVDLLLLRGLVREAAGDGQGALDDFRLAWSIDPADPVISYLVGDRGLSLDGTVDIQPQIEALTAAQEASLGPRSDAAFSGLALLEDNLAKVPVFVPAAYAAGFALVGEGQYREAITSFREAAARDPLLVDPAAASPGLRQGVASLRQGAVQAARDALELAAAEFPGSSEARRFLGLAYRAEGRPDDAVAALQQAIALAPADDRARVTLARMLMEQGRWEEAERGLLETIDLLPQAAEARWVLSYLYDERNRIEEAADVLGPAAALVPPVGRGEIFFRRAWLHDLRHDLEAAAVAFDARARLNPRAPTAYLDLGLAYWRSGDHRRSLLALLLASVLDPDDPESLAAIGQIHLDAGRLGQAEAALRRAVALAPNREQAVFALGRTLVRLGREEEGRARLAEFADLARKNLEDAREEFTLDKLTEEAEARAEQGQYAEAAGLWREVVDLEPGRASYRIALADVLAAGGRQDAALQELEAAATMQPSLDVYRRLAMLYRRLGRADEAAAAEAQIERLAGRAPPGR
jgi:tetratricopeptide (TPR) repeat protein